VGVFVNSLSHSAARLRHGLGNIHRSGDSSPTHIQIKFSQKSLLDPARRPSADIAIDCLQGSSIEFFQGEIKGPSDGNFKVYRCNLMKFLMRANATMPRHSGSDAKTPKAEFKRNYPRQSNHNFSFLCGARPSLKVAVSTLQYKNSEAYRPSYNDLS